MSSSADRSSVRAELERKRVLLAQMKQERERRSRANQTSTVLDPQQPLLGSQGTGQSEDADSILQALGLSASLSRVTSFDLSSRNQSSTGATASPSQVVTAAVGPNESGEAPKSSTPLATGLTKSAPLQVVHVNQVSIAPKERVYYTKSTQTPGQEQSPPPSREAPPKKKSYYQLALEWDDEFPTVEDEEISNVPVVAAGSEDAVDQQQQQQQQAPESSTSSSELKELTEDQRRQIEQSEDYQQFIDKATKILERALCQNESPEIFIQYFPEGGKGAVDSDRKSGNKLSLNRIFFDEKWSKNKCVTGFDWSSQYPELLLASYYTNEQAPSDPDGTLLVWNMKFRNTSPEYVFHCQSPIMSCCYAKFHPSLIVGGTYSGQIVVWDMRSNKKTPVQRSPLTATAHTHPVYCTKVVGTQNAHNLISISTDGKLCSWSLDMLSAPQETMELNQQKQTRSVAVTCMSFHPDDYNNFLVGSEEGTVYSACRHGSKTGILSNFEGHQGLVTSVDYRPFDTQPGDSHKFLTSSIDWTVKLWDSKQPDPIHSFEVNSDYIYDVKWSPNNAALFATADGAGKVDIWNLANDVELPVASTYVDVGAGGDIKAQPSLNKLIWTPSGDQIVVGDDVGRIHVYDIGEVDDSSRRQEDKWKLGDPINRVKM